MSITSIQQRINEAMRETKFSVRTHRNCIRLNTSCSDKHNMEIVKRCLEMLKIGCPFFTEVAFTEGRGVCDILYPSLHEIDEILVSESDERFEEKVNKYPSCFKINKIRV